MSCIAHSRVEAMVKTPPRLDLVVSAKKHEEGALQILKLVRPGWRQEDVGFRVSKIDLLWLSSPVYNIHCVTVTS